MPSELWMFLGGHAFVTVCGFVALAFRFEHRLTKVETHLLHVMPKRSTDRVHG